MAQLSIGDAVGAGFSLIWRRPGDVLLWGVLELILAVAAFGLFGSVYVEMLSGIIARAQSGVTTAPMFDVARFAQIQGWSWLFSLASAFTRTVVFCAICRAVLHPDQGRFAYLRLGSAELLLFVLQIGAYIVFLVGVAIVVFVGALLIAGLALAHAGAAAVIVGLVGGIAMIIGVAFIAARLSLVGPMIVDDGRFHLTDAWALTRRHAGGLFVVMLCLVALVILAQIVFGLIAVLTGATFLAATAGGFDHLSTFFRRPPGEILSGMSPLLGISVVVSAPLLGAFMAVTGAPWARAYRDLAGPDLSATFA